MSSLRPLIFALAAHARAHDLGQAVVFGGEDAVAAFEFGAHLLGAGLRAEQAHAQADVLERVHALGHLGHVKGVAGGGDQHGGAKIAHDVDLAFGVAAGDGDDGAADLLKPAVQAERAGKEGVSEADLRDVVRRNAAGGSDAGDALRPGIQVAPGVAGGDGLARGAAGCVDAHHLAHGHSQ